MIEKPVSQHLPGFVNLEIFRALFRAALLAELARLLSAKTKVPQSAEGLDQPRKIEIRRIEPHLLPGLQTLNPDQLASLAERCGRFRGEILEELVRRDGPENVFTETIAPDSVRVIRITKKPPSLDRPLRRPSSYPLRGAEVADAPAITKDQLARFRKRLSEEDRAAFDEYRNDGPAVLDVSEEPTRAFTLFPEYLSNAPYQVDSEETDTSKRSLPLGASLPPRRPRPLTPLEQLIDKETPGWTLGESPLEESQALSGEERRRVRIRRFPERSMAEDADDAEPSDHVEVMGASSRAYSQMDLRICELLLGGLKESAIIKVMQYEILPPDLRDIEFPDLYQGKSTDPKLRARIRARFCTEEGQELLKSFNRAKVSAVTIRDRIRAVRGRILRFKKMKGANNGNSSCND